MLRKLLSIGLAMLLVLALPVRVLAEEYDLATGSITVTADDSGQYVQQENYTDDSRTYVENKGYQESTPTVITQSTPETPTDNTVTLSSSGSAAAEVTLDGVNTTGGITVTSGSSAEITVQGENQVKGDVYKAGVEVSEGSTLTITEDSTGKLEANGWLAAGIGGSDGQSAGTVIIEGGTVIANGSVGSAGIGGGSGGNGGTVIITDGTVEAKGGATGIGGGGGITAGAPAGQAYSDNPGGKGGNGGTVIIEGGNVTATGSGGADIGGGDGGYGKNGGAGGDGANVTITGGTVTAPNIGGGGGGITSPGGSPGSKGADGSLSITGGIVNGVDHNPPAPPVTPDPAPAAQPEAAAPAPVVIAEEETPLAAAPTFWDTIAWKLSLAEEGSEFIIDAEGQTYIPSSILELAKDKDITLIIKWSGDDITVKPSDEIDLTKWSIPLKDLA